MGYVNYFGGLLGLPEVNWLTSETWVKPVVVFVSLWHVGVPMIIFLAGLGGIPEQLYEAAQIDGASPWQRLLNVTVPLMTPVILYNVIIDIINSFQVFDSRPGLIQRNEVAGDLRAPVLRANEIEQMAFIARMGTVWVAIVDTGQGVLES